MDITGYIGRLLQDWGIVAKDHAAHLWAESELDRLPFQDAMLVRRVAREHDLDPRALTEIVLQANRFPHAAVMTEDRLLTLAATHHQMG